MTSYAPAEAALLRVCWPPSTFRNDISANQWRSGCSITSTAMVAPTFPNDDSYKEAAWQQRII